MPDALATPTPPPPLADPEPIFDSLVIEDLETRFGAAALVDEVEAFLELLSGGF